MRARDERRKEFAGGARQRRAKRRRDSPEQAARQLYRARCGNDPACKRSPERAVGAKTSRILSEWQKPSYALPNDLATRRHLSTPPPCDIFSMRAGQEIPASLFRCEKFHRIGKLVEQMKGRNLHHIRRKAIHREPSQTHREDEAKARFRAHKRAPRRKRLRGRELPAAPARSGSQQEGAAQSRRKGAPLRLQRGHPRRKGSLRHKTVQAAQEKARGERNRAGKSPRALRTS